MFWKLVNDHIDSLVLMRQKAIKLDLDDKIMSEAIYQMRLLKASLSGVCVSEKAEL